MSYLIKDTTKQERIELIRSWVPTDEAMEGCDVILRGRNPSEDIFCLKVQRHCTL